MTELPFASFTAASASFEKDVLLELSPEASLAHRNVDGGTGPDAVKRQLEAARVLLASVG
jgi:argininosuccinate lyase